MKSDQRVEMMEAVVDVVTSMRHILVDRFISGSILNYRQNIYIFCKLNHIDGRVGRSCALNNAASCWLTNTAPLIARWYLMNISTHGIEIKILIKKKKSNPIPTNIINRYDHVEHFWEVLHCVRVLKD